MVVEASCGQKNPRMSQSTMYQDIGARVANDHYNLFQNSVNVKQTSGSVGA